MTYQVRLSKAIRKRLDRLPGHVRNIFRKRIISLAEQPRPDDAQELEGHLGYYRLWIRGNFRLVWQVLDDDQVVDILYVGPKSPQLYAFLGLARPKKRRDNNRS